MGQLTQLQHQIKSIKTTEKITHAVRLVSMSLYSKLEKQNITLRYFQENISNLFFQFLLFCPKWKNYILFPKDILDSNPLFIIISSAKGLCGSFNSNLFKFFERRFFLEEHQIPTFITIGQKAKKFIQLKKFGQIEYSYDSLTLSNFSSIADELLCKINEKQTNYSSISFYSNHIKNFFVQQPHKIALTPINPKYFNKEKQSEINYNINIIWEQNKNEILNFIANKYLRSQILEIIFQSLLGENAARFIAMDNSTTNAKKYLEKLTLQYNKSRQSLITREVSELSVNF